MIKETFGRIFNLKVDALGLAVFRMIYTLILFAETLQLYNYRNIIYDDLPFIRLGEINVIFIFTFWFITLAFLFLGLFTRTALILNYVFAVIIFSSATNFEYHVFYAYVGMNFLMLFMPVSRVLSLDSLIRKIKYTNIGRPYIVDRKILEINYLAPVFVAIALVYFDSVFYKLSSRMWTDGLGMWMPSSLPMMIWIDTSFILNNEFFVRFLGYLVVVFETVFIFLFWFRRFRVPFLLLGMFLHLGILIAYPIPWFALCAVGVYLLMVPQGFWTGISASFKSKTQTYKFYYDAECPLCNKVIVVIRHFDVFKKVNCLTVQGNAENDIALNGISENTLLIDIHAVDNKNRIYKGYAAYVQLLKHMIYTFPLALLLSLPGISHVGKRIYRYIAGHRLTERCTSENCLMPEYSLPVNETDDFLVEGWNRLSISKNFWKTLLIVFTIFQLLLIGISPTVQKYIKGTVVSDGLVSLNARIVPPLRKFTGIGPHPVFMYNIHFEGYNHIFKFVCTNNNKRVPILDNNGMVTKSYANGALWVNYTFRVSSHTLVKEVYEQGIIPYLSHFENENGLSSSEYIIYVKEIETTDHWQKDFLHNQMKKPWQPAGKCKLDKGRSEFEWNDKMKAVFEAEKKDYR